QALWYFAGETIAVPRPGLAAANFTRGVTAWDDLRQWAGTHALDGRLDAPPLLWIGSPEIVRGARLSVDGKTLSANGHNWSSAPAARSVTGSPTISTRSTPKARKASSPRWCRWTITSPISTAVRRGIGPRTSWSRS